MSDTAAWSNWGVATQSGFVVDSPDGWIRLAQDTKKDFRVTTRFAFIDTNVRDRLTKSVVRNGHPLTEAAGMVDQACTFVLHGDDRDDTDLALIPTFMRWFVNTYGVHTLAAILHDQMIGKPANSGALGSDTLADQFFREMMRSAGVPWLQRWIMWAAVAMRTRWAASGLRRVSLVLRAVLATVGIALLVWSLGAFAGWPHAVAPWAMLVISLGLPIAAAPLWGQQYGASFVAAIAALWILPPALLGLIGFGIYTVLEHVAHAVHLR